MVNSWANIEETINAVSLSRISTSDSDAKRKKLEKIRIKKKENEEVN